MIRSRSNTGSRDPRHEGPIAPPDANLQARKQGVPTARGILSSRHHRQEHWWLVTLHDLEESIKGIDSLVNLFVFRPLFPVLRESLKHSRDPFAHSGFGVAERHRYNDISASIIE